MCSTLVLKLKAKTQISVFQWAKIGQNDHSNPYIESTTVLSDNVMQILCIIIMPSGARRCIKIINSVIFRARAPRMVHGTYRLGRLRQLSTVSVFSLCTSRCGTAQVQETARAGEYAATSPLSRVTAAAFPIASEYDTASSPARDHTCVCVCFILCDRLPYTAYVESPALAWCLYQVPIMSQSCE